MYDEKIISRTIQYFEEALPNNNKFVVLRNNNNNKPIVTLDSPNILYTLYGSDDFRNFIGDTSQYKNVILHYLGEELVDFVYEAQQTDNFVWIVWGGDLYNSLLGPYGYKLYAYTDFIKKGKLGTFLPFIDRYLNRRAIWKRVEAVKKIPSYVIFEGDLKALKKYFPKLHPQRRDFFYYPVDDMVDDSLKKRQLTGNNIFVGNSASPTNNHRKVFEILSTCDLGNRKVITPLSYGPESGRDYAIKWGYELIKDNFYPITDYMPLEEYNKLMFSANIFVYGNYRQEAFGNILVALYLGGIVVLSSRNPLTEDLKKKGFMIFSLKHLKDLLNYKLPDDVKRRNQELVIKWYSRKRLLNVIKESFG